MLGAKNEVDAIGWAAGIERLSILLEDIDEKQLIGKQPFTIGVIGLTGIDIDTKVQNATMSLTQKLRNSNELLASKFVVVGPVYTSKVLNGLQKLEKEGCSVVVLLGSREIENGTCSIKNMLNRNLKDECKIEQIIESLNKMYESLLI
jgi:histidyl-tRNA synthetase